MNFEEEVEKITKRLEGQAKKISKHLEGTVRLKINVLSGKIGETQVLYFLRVSGFSNVKKIHKGLDYTAEKDGKTYYIEVKTGRAKLSKAQKEMREKVKELYIVIRPTA